MKIARFMNFRSFLGPSQRTSCLYERLWFQLRILSGISVFVACKFSCGQIFFVQQHLLSWLWEVLLSLRRLMTRKHITQPLHVSNVLIHQTINANFTSIVHLLYVYTVQKNNSNNSIRACINFPFAKTHVGYGDALSIFSCRNGKVIGEQLALIYISKGKIEKALAVSRTFRAKWSAKSKFTRK